MMQDVPLAIPHIFERAERYHPHKGIVTATGRDQLTTSRRGHSTYEDFIAAGLQGRIGDPAVIRRDTALRLELKILDEAPRLGLANLENPQVEVRR